MVLAMDMLHADAEQSPPCSFLQTGMFHKVLLGPEMQQAQYCSVTQVSVGYGYGLC